jgi:hypothetical protein
LTLDDLLPSDDKKTKWSDRNRLGEGISDFGRQRCALEQDARKPVTAHFAFSSRRLECLLKLISASRVAIASHDLKNGVT